MHIFLVKKRKNKTHIFQQKPFSCVFSALYRMWVKSDSQFPRVQCQPLQFQVCFLFCVLLAPLVWKAFICCLLTPHASLPEKKKGKCKRAITQDLSIYQHFLSSGLRPRGQTKFFITNETLEICLLFFILWQVYCSKEHKGQGRGILSLTPSYSLRLKLYKTQIMDIL